jgi:hypothetical protein
MPSNIIIIDISSACVDRIPRRLKVLFTLICSIKKRCVPMMMSMMENKAPRMFIFLRRNHNNRKNNVHNRKS